MADLPAANTLNWHGNNTLTRRSKSQFLTLQMWVFFPIAATLLEDDPMAFIISTITTRLWFFQNPQNSWHDLESSLSKQGYLFSDSFLHMIIPTVVLYDADSGFTTIAQAFDSEFLKLLLPYLSLYPSRGLRCFCDCLTDMHDYRLGLWSCKPVFLSWRSFSIVHVWGCILEVVYNRTSALSVEDPLIHMYEFVFLRWFYNPTTVLSVEGPSVCMYYELVFLREQRWLVLW